MKRTTQSVLLAGLLALSLAACSSLSAGWKGLWGNGPVGGTSNGSATGTTNGHTGAEPAPAPAPAPSNGSTSDKGTSGTPAGQQP